MIARKSEICDFRFFFMEKSSDHFLVEFHVRFLDSDSIFENFRENCPRPHNFTLECFLSAENGGRKQRLLNLKIAYISVSNKFLVFFKARLPDHANKVWARFSWWGYRALSWWETVEKPQRTQNHFTKDRWPISNSTGTGWEITVRAFAEPFFRVI